MQLFHLQGVAGQGLVNRDNFIQFFGCAGVLPPVYRTYWPAGRLPRFCRTGSAISPTSICRPDPSRCISARLCLPTVSAALHPDTRSAANFPESLPAGKHPSGNRSGERSLTSVFNVAAWEQETAVFAVGREFRGAQVVHRALPGFKPLRVKCSNDRSINFINLLNEIIQLVDK